MEYDNGGVVRKFTDGIILSFVIMGLFMILQILISVAAALGVMTAFMINAGDAGNFRDAQLLAMDMMEKGDFMTALLVLTTAASAVFAVGFYWAVWGRRRTWQDVRYLRGTLMRARSILVICIASVGLYYLALLLSEVIGVVSPETMENYNEMMEDVLGGSQLLVMLAVVLIAPVNEECLMRGLVLRNLQRFFPDKAVIIMQAVMFGILHWNWVQGIYTVPVGVALGYLAVKSRSVLPCIFMHLFYNMLSFVMVILPGFCQTGLFAVAAVFVCGAAVFVLVRTDSEKREGGINDV